MTAPAGTASDAEREREGPAGAVPGSVGRMRIFSQMISVNRLSPEV